MTTKTRTAIVALVLSVIVVAVSLAVIGRKSRLNNYPSGMPDSLTVQQSEYGLVPPPDARMSRPPGIVADQMVQSNIPGGGIDVSAAPGVAFRYSYAFRLPNANIAGVQEAHAQACEKLGLERCRITGMRYTVSDQDDVRAMLAFKLAPDLARQFGKDGIAAIQKAQGSLVDAAISGNDMGTAIDQSRRRTASLEARIKLLEARLKEEGARRGDDSDSTRNQIAGLRSELEREAQNRTDAGEALANTPMVFQYNSGSALSTSALGEALATSTNGFVAIIGLFVIALGLLLPWLLLAGAMWLLIRRFWKPTATPVAALEATL